jgi:eukaryotic-like serine/threonine-protein kinase
VSDASRTVPGAGDTTRLAQARADNRLLAELLEMPAADRDALLRQRCGDDEAMRLRIERLLQLAESEHSALDPGAPLAQGFADALLDSEPGLPPDAQIGRYRILREIGRGGMSVVYLAEQQAEGFSQLVALKRMHAATEHSGLLRRFARERRILALLSHPDIARIVDVGGDAQARPYIVMEHVDGQPIDAYCDTHRLGLRERLQLFCRVAAAVAFAHAKLVVHRDIKPSNILVDRNGHPKLLDFGIAKLVDDDDLQLTATARAPQTPAYASPEQVRGEPADTASDVYQLGLLLHLLLCGAMPYPHRELSPRELARTILAGSLPLPSRCVQGMDPERAEAHAYDRRMPNRGTLARALRGDLDSIVARAIALEPEDRYPSAVHLADDVRNALEGRPVQAGRRSWIHALGKTLRRHPVASLLAASLLVSLLAFALIVTSIAIDLDRARRSAIQQGELSDRVLDHVIASLRELEPELSGFDGSIVRKALDRASAAPPANFGEGALTRVHLHLTLGRGYEAVWATDQAQEQYQLAQAQLGELRGDDRRRMEARVWNGLGRVARIDGRGSEAEAAFRRVIELAANDQQLRSLRAHARANLATLMGGREEQAAALALYREAATEFDAIYGPEHPNSLTLRQNIALTLLQRDAQSEPHDIDESLRLLRRLLDDAEAHLGAEAPLTLTARLLLGRAMCYGGDPQGGERELLAVLPLATARLGAQSLQVLVARSTLGLAQVRLGQAETGMALLQDSAAVFQQRWDRNRRHSSRHSFGMNLATAQQLLGRPDDAIAILLEHRVGHAHIARSGELSALLSDPRLAQAAEEADP